LRGLLEAMQAYKLDSGWLLTFDQNETIKINEQTIHVISMPQWLLANEP